MTAEIKTTYIEAIDMKSKTGPNTQRKISLGMNQKLRPGVLNLLGNLPHNSDITFNRKNAILLVKWLNDNIINVYDNHTKPITQKQKDLERAASC